MGRLITASVSSDAGKSPNADSTVPQSSSVPVDASSLDGGSPPKSAGTDSGSGTHRRTWAFVAVAVIVAVAVVVAAIAYADLKHASPSSTAGDVLVPAGTLYSLPVDQYNAVEFAQQTSATVTATLTNVGGAQLYLMSPSQYLHLVLTYNVTGYQWTSGAIPSNTYYHLDITVPVGSWDLVFSNSVPGNSTAIGFYTNLVETS